MRFSLLTSIAAVLFGCCQTQSASADFFLFAAESQDGSLGDNTAAYGGVQQYGFATTGGAATMGAGLPSSSVRDPVGLVFRNENLFVSNRHGNTLGQGSVQSFSFNTGVLSGGTTIATESNAAFQGFHGIFFASNDDLFVSSVNSGTRRYRDSGSGYADIGGVASGAVRDVWISPDGNKMIETTLGNTIRVTDLLPNSFGSSTSFVVNGSSVMHQMAFLNGSLYVTGFGSGSVHQISLDANFNPVSSTTILNVSAAIGIAFSPDGQEMFVSGHTTSLINRFLASGNTWNANGTISTNHKMGYLATAVPEPGPFVVLGLLSMGVAIRRSGFKR